MEIKTTEQIYRGEFKEFDEETESHHRIKWMPVDDLISQLEDWNNNEGLNLHEVIKRLVEIKVT